MKAHSEEVKQKVLELLRQQRGPKETSVRTGISINTIEDWAAEWRKDGTLENYTRAGQRFTNRAKNMSNGYYKVIRKRYLGMRWTDKIAGRTFGFSNPTEVIHYYLDESGNPRLCTYCGRKPDSGKVWGLDRIDSTLGHQPGNLVPCCSSHPESSQLSCQLSKSKFTLRSWIETALTRTYGYQIPSLLVDMRMAVILSLAKSLAMKGN